MNHNRRLVPALLCLALVILASVTSGAVAAKMVTSADIKNGTIQVKDLNKKTIKKLKGKRGKKGNTGTTGTNGTNGANGSAIAYGHFTGAGTADASLTEGLEFVSLAAPGYICLNYTGGTPHVVMVTTDSTNAGNDGIVSVATDSQSASLCGGDADILVNTSKGDAYVATMSFYIAVIS